MPQHTLTDSEFYMWRALFAFAFTDDVLTDQEKSILRAYQSEAVFSEKQLAVLRDDFAAPKSASDMFNKITDHRDRVRFCALARALMWCDGDPERQEVEIMKRVGCLSSPDNIEILRSSRDSEMTHAYYGQYAKTGALGMFDSVNTFRLSA
jgi:hypothetical protein